MTADVPGCDHTLHYIVLLSEVRPIKPLYRLNPQKKAAMKREVEYLLKPNLADPSNSPWASPCILVPKPDGSAQLCTDYRYVNKVAINDSYPLPINELIDSVGQARYLTKIDLQKGYYQIGLNDRAKHLPLTGQNICL